MLMVKTRRSEVVRVVRLRFLSIVNGFNCLVCVRRLLPLIPPPHGVGVVGSEIVWLVVTG